MSGMFFGDVDSISFRPGTFEGQEELHLELSVRNRIRTARSRLTGTFFIHLDKLAKRWEQLQNMPCAYVQHEKYFTFFWVKSL